MKIRTKLIIGCTIFSLFTISVGTLGTYTSSNIAKKSLLIDKVHELVAIESDVHLTLIQLIATNTEQESEEKIQDYAEYLDLFQFGYNELLQDPNVQNQPLFGQFHDTYESFLTTATKLIENHQQLIVLQKDESPEGVNRYQEALEKERDLSRNLDKIEIELRMMADEIPWKFREELQWLSYETLVSTYFTGALIFLTLLINFFISFVFSRLITSPITNLVQAASTIARGNLNVRVPVSGEDELGELGKAFNEMAVKLKRKTEQLEESKIEAEKANRSKGQFLGCMSHELRTPLNAIIGYSEILQEGLEMGDYFHMKEDISKITLSGRQLLTIINDILDLEKIEANMVKLHYEQIEVKKILGEIEAIIQPIIRNNKNTLHLEIAPNVDYFAGDFTKSKQILLNLLSNASKFTKLGKVTLKVYLTKIDGEEFIHFAVTDTGIGMNSEQMEKIFKPFTQADASTTREYGGTGLGLVISKNFAELMGGRIRLESKYGVGSTFEVVLPKDHILADRAIC
jgi:signal transduction histidine kinase